MKPCCSSSSTRTGQSYRWILLVLALFVGLALGSCTKEAGIEGPALVDLFGDFQVLEPVKASRDSVRFGQGETVYLQGRFNKLTDWRLEVQGLSSGARKIIQGKSRSLDALNCVWNGSTTLFPMFRAEETEIRLLSKMTLCFSTSNQNFERTAYRRICGRGFRKRDTSRVDLLVQSGANMSFCDSYQPFGGSG